MSETADIIEGKIEECDALREAFFAEDSTCFLLDGDGHLQPYSITRQIEAGWYLDVKGKKLIVATFDLTVDNDVLKSNHFAVNGRIYRIEAGGDEAGDGKNPPEGEEPWWELSYVRTGERFNP